MTTAIYTRVSTKHQEMVSQEADLKLWEAMNGVEAEWFSDKATGTDYNRPGWMALWDGVEAGQIKRVVVWRLDRMGRTALETIRVMDDLERRGVGFWSIRDGFDPSTPAGRLTRNVLASVAQFETEVRRERQNAGIRAAQEEVRSGVRAKYGSGNKKGRLRKVTPEMLMSTKIMQESGQSIAFIARQLKVSRRTVYNALEIINAEKNAPILEPSVKPCAEISAVVLA